MTSEDPIAAFWRWWAQARSPLADAIATRTLAAWDEPITAQVRAIDEGLAWELGPGKKSERHFCLSGEGDARLRVVTERWLSRAPQPDEWWDYYPARQPSGRGPRRAGERRCLHCARGGGRRVIHLHVAPGGRAQEAIARWECIYPTWDIDVVARADPQWSILRRW